MHKIGVLPNPDSDMVSQIHVVDIAPRTSRKLVNMTCLTLRQIKAKINRATVIIIIIIIIIRHPSSSFKLGRTNNILSL
jgi:hypothetical protein